MPTVGSYMSFRSSRRFKMTSYPAESAAGGLKKSRSSCSNGSLRRAESRKAGSLEAQQELQQPAGPRQEALR
ncbi:hypothetical protein EYF80_066487 [Liparis tanakae]|uniref:Uncharacterized protein n=1 Tax=Liparis tanakae TaxID=230148 RepID=A0A4Z2E3V9_9TELE|nr:hypothetical protein EYF80_066487 [Liparis tanakae]